MRKRMIRVPDATTRPQAPHHATRSGGRALATRALKDDKVVALEQASQSNELDLGGLDEILGFLVRRAHTVIQKDFMATLEELDVTQRQAATLWLIDANPAVSQSQLANVLMMDRASMLAIINKLDARGLIRRTRSNADRRRLDLMLTARGKELLAKTKARIGEHEDRFTQLFSEGELLVLREKLQAIVETG